MHVEEPRLIVEHVVVKRRDFDSVVTQSFDLGVDLFADKTKSPVVAGFPPPVG